MRRGPLRPSCSKQARCKKKIVASKHVSKNKVLASKHVAISDQIKLEKKVRCVDPVDEA